MTPKTKFELKSGPATREAFGRALVELGRENKDIVVCDADLSKSTMTVYFQKEFPERFFSFGIAEADMVATGAGMAMAGKIPVRFQLLGFRHEQGLRAAPHLRGLSPRQPEGGGHAQRHLHRRGRPFADERRGNRAGLLAGRFRGAGARR